MKKILLSSLVAAVVLMAGCGNTEKKDEKQNEAVEMTTATKNGNDSISMSLGRVMGSEIRKDTKLDKTAFIDGMKQSLFAADLSAVEQLFTELQKKAGTATGDEKTKLTSQMNGINYGAMMSQQFESFESMGLIVDKAKLFKALSEVAKDSKEVDTSSDQARLDLFFADMQKKQMEIRQKQAEANKAAGEKFMADLKKNDPTVKTTSSGLAYRIVKKGTGATLKQTDVARVKYKGTHIDGTLFDDGGGREIEFSPQSVVKGFGEGLMLMNPGSKYVLYIPGDLAYGPSGTPGGPIGPNETLVFEVELVGVK